MRRLTGVVTEALVKRSTVLHLGSDRLRVGPWRGDARTAFVAPLTPGSSPDPTMVAFGLTRLRDDGYVRVMTSALAPHEQQGFLAAGFTVREHLHLLAHRLARPSPRPSRLVTPAPASGTGARTLRDTRAATIRRARRRDWPAVLHIDGAAFDPFWRFDEHGLRDALTATPVNRFRIARADRPLGYAVTGRSRDRGYLQRLAVDPLTQGHGIGRALVSDALSWLGRRGATSALVNTQETNHAALGL
jgi:GNAT superfamily N-acetyltransferase